MRQRCCRTRRPCQHSRRWVDHDVDIRSYAVVIAGRCRREAYALTVGSNVGSVGRIYPGKGSGDIGRANRQHGVAQSLAICDRASRRPVADHGSSLGNGEGHILVGTTNTVGCPECGVVGSHTAWCSADQSVRGDVQTGGKTGSTKRDRGRTTRRHPVAECHPHRPAEGVSRGDLRPLPGTVNPPDTKFKR